MTFISPDRVQSSSWVRTSAHGLIPYRPFQSGQDHLQRHVKHLRPMRHPRQQMKMIAYDKAERWWPPARQTAMGCPQGGMAVGRLFHH